MNPNDLLIIYVEVSIAIAGFGGIVAALKKQDSSAWGQEESIRFRFLLTASGASALFCAIPMILAIGEIAEPMNWQISSGVVALVGTIAGSFRSYQLRGTLASKFALAQTILMVTFALVSMYIGLAVLFIALVTCFLMIVFATFVNLVLKLAGDV